MPYQIDDSRTFDENMTELGRELNTLDPTLGPVLETCLSRLATGAVTAGEVWKALLDAITGETAQ